MKIMIPIDALRKGATLPNPTKWKWTNIVTVLALIALKVSQSFGILEEVHDEYVIELVGLLIVLYLPLATSSSLGVLPARPVSEPDSVRAEPVPTGVDAAKRDANGFPEGPFFDNH